MRYNRVIARLEHIESGRFVPVRARHLVGRAPDADLRLDQPRVSSLHAELFYQGNTWFIRDLGSRNGTTVDGVRVSPGTAVPLRAGSRLAFAGPANAWTLTTAGAPRAAAVPVDGGRAVEAEDGVIALPSSDAPTLVVVQGAEGDWRGSGSDAAMKDGEVVEAGGRAWRLSLPSAVEHTHVTGAGGGARVVLAFVVSRDEEHVEVTVRWDEEAFTPRARAHAYTLLTLARRRLADEQAGALPPEERGWIHQDDLCRQLRVDANLLHTHLFRARRQLADAGVPDTAGLIERRLDAGQLRLGLAAIEVVVR